MSSQNRRQFLQGCAVAGGAAFLLSAAESKSLLIESWPSGSLHRRLAQRELLRGLTRLQPAADVKFTASGSSSQAAPVFRLRVDAGNFKNKISGLGNGCMLSVPAIISGGHYHVHPLSRAEAIEVTLLFEGAPVSISLRLHN